MRLLSAKTGSIHGWCVHDGHGMTGSAVIHQSGQSIESCRHQPCAVQHTEKECRWEILVSYPDGRYSYHTQGLPSLQSTHTGAMHGAVGQAGAARVRTVTCHPWRVANQDKALQVGDIIHVSYSTQGDSYELLASSAETAQQYIEIIYIEPCSVCMV